MKECFRENLIKELLLCTLLLVSGCASIGDESADIKECRILSYSEQNDNLGATLEDIFAQCVAEKKALREKANQEAATMLWLDFFLELLLSSEDSADR